MSQNHSAEWLRGRKQGLLDAYGRSAAKGAEMQYESGVAANQIYYTANTVMAIISQLIEETKPLLAEAEAREAAQPSAAEVIQAAEKALLQVGKWDAFTQREKTLMKEALALIGDWKAGRG